MRLASATWWWCRAVQARLPTPGSPGPRLGNSGITNTAPGSRPPCYPTNTICEGDPITVPGGPEESSDLPNITKLGMQRLAAEATLHHVLFKTRSLSLFLEDLLTSVTSRKCHPQHLRIN